MNDQIIEIDARRLFCPMPVIRLQDCLKQHEAGTKVQITCTDPGVMSDIPTWCRINGHLLLSSHENELDYILVVEKGSDGS